MDYWCVTGLLGRHQQNPGTGNPREFTPHEAEVLRTAGRLRKLGLELEAVRRLVRDKTAEELRALVDRAERALV